MVKAPDAMPVTMPVPEPTVAKEVLLLVQLPPDVPSLNVRVRPTHTFVDPDMEAGNA